MGNYCPSLPIKLHQLGHYWLPGGCEADSVFNNHGRLWQLQLEVDFSIRILQPTQCSSKPAQLIPALGFWGLGSYSNRAGSPKGSAEEEEGPSKCVLWPWTSDERHHPSAISPGSEETEAHCACQTIRAALHPAASSNNNGNIIDYIVTSLLLEKLCKYKTAENCYWLQKFYQRKKIKMKLGSIAG